MNLLLTLLVAASPVSLHDEPKVLGWTKDGTTFIWSWGDTEYVDDPKNPDSMLVAETARVGAAYDLRTGSESTFLLEYKVVNARSNGSLKSRYFGVEDMKKWTGEHPNERLTGLAGPKGASAVVTVDGKAGTEWSCDDVRKIVVTVKKGKAEARYVIEDGMEAMFTAERSAELVWDPTGRRVAFVVKTASAHTMRGDTMARGRVHFLSVPPRVEVLATARLEKTTTELARKIDLAGYDVVNVGVPQKDREATVIYAAEGHEALAKTISALVPGSTIEKLTWKANAEVVVALGAPSK